MYILVNNTQTLVLSDHLELDHEREMPGYWTFEELERGHSAMHRMSDDWDHSH